MTKTLDDLVPGGPVLSDVFELDSRPGAKYRLKLLDSIETMRCRTYAQRATLKMLEDVLEGDRDLAVRMLNESGPSADTFTEWQELFALQAALLTEDGLPIEFAGKTPEEAAYALGDRFTPIERAELVRRYLEFADEHDPADISDDDIEEIIAAAGGTGDPSTLRRYGSSALRRSLLTTAVRLAEAQRQIVAMDASQGSQMDLAERIEELERVISRMRKSSDG